VVSVLVMDLGFRIALGALPIDHHTDTTSSIGLGAETALIGGVRGFGEYEWMWLQRDADHVYGDGHRIQLGVREQLAAHEWMSFRFYLDGELGGGFSLVTDNMTGLHQIPDGFVGLRVGYDVLPHTARSPATRFRTEILARAIAIPGGVGWFGGVGMWWGD
jgi:hypothetical protein